MHQYVNVKEYTDSRIKQDQAGLNAGYWTFWFKVVASFVRDILDNDAESSVQLAAVLLKASSGVSQWRTTSLLGSNA